MPAGVIIFANEPVHGRSGRSFLPHERPTEMRDFQNVSGPGMGPLSELLAEAELRDQVRVTLCVLATEIIEERAALVDHHE